MLATLPSNTPINQLQVVTNIPIRRADLRRKVQCPNPFHIPKYSFQSPHIRKLTISF